MSFAVTSEIILFSVQILKKLQKLTLKMNKTQRDETEQKKEKQQMKWLFGTRQINNTRFILICFGWKLLLFTTENWFKFIITVFTTTQN